MFFLCAREETVGSLHIVCLTLSGYLKQLSFCLAANAILIDLLACQTQPAETAKAGEKKHRQNVNSLHTCTHSTMQSQFFIPTARLQTHNAIIDRTGLYKTDRQSVSACEPPARETNQAVPTWLSFSIIVTIVVLEWVLAGWEF